MSDFPLHGLYLILDQRWSDRVCLTEVLREAAAGGVGLFQYRNKDDSLRKAYSQAMPLRVAASEASVKFIINDRCDLAMALRADGVHLGQDDLPVALARSLLGPQSIIGVSTHDLEQVKVASQGSADYLGFGPVFPTTTKANPDPVVGIDGVKLVCAQTHLPVFAIGGITAESLPSLLRAGAAGVAVASGVLNAQDVKGTLTRFLGAWS